ncbi:MAG: trimethylamine methyltransferase family protein, partial [Bryobacteraceae bacterium]|nr:trimethylamine methyltransferase family protein [Bryobacteraceae bacterium]
EELLREKHLLIAEHTRRHLREQITFPGRVLDRANRERWAKAGAPSLVERAVREVERLVGEYQPSRLPSERKEALRRRMQEEAQRHGMAELPAAE